jgi:hypothetical protein
MAEPASLFTTLRQRKPIKTLLTSMAAVHAANPDAILVAPDEVARLFDEAWDGAQRAIWGETVCSACGENHDRDESAMCEDGEVVTFREWVEAKRG